MIATTLRQKTKNLQGILIWQVSTISSISLFFFLENFKNILQIGSCRKSYLYTFISLYGLPYFSCIVGAGTGVENDELTMLSARIMVLSVIPFIVAQLSRIFNFTGIGNIPIIVALVLSLAGLLSYCLYQVCYLLCLFLKAKSAIITSTLNFHVKRCQTD